MSFQQGLSGLNASSKNLEVIGNNVANAGTYGAKSSRAEFADMYASAIAGAGGSNIGIGVNVAAVAQQFTQGNISTTGNSLDLAINGSGFFQVLDTSSGQTVYTRNGQFKQDKDGYIVNAQGQQLVGYQADAQGMIQAGAASAVQLPTAGIAPSVTSSVSLELNVDSSSAVTAPTPAAIDITDASTFNNATTVTAYNRQGETIATTYYFQKSSTGWNVYMAADGTLASTSPVTSIAFNTSGTSPTFSTASPVPVDLSALGLNIGTVSLDLSNVTEYGSAFAVTEATQDGFAAGQLSSISIDESGVLMASYSNGQSKAAGQLELATFRNPQGLQPLGGNTWARTFASGEAVVGTPGAGNMGVLQSGALEESNVDLTAELVNMMTAQRVYQANSQTIKTQDTILQTLVNMR